MKFSSEQCHHDIQKRLLTTRPRTVTSVFVKTAKFSVLRCQSYSFHDTVRDCNWESKPLLVLLSFSCNLSPIEYCALVRFERTIIIMASSKFVKDILFFPCNRHLWNFYNVEKNTSNSSRIERTLFLTSFVLFTSSIFCSHFTFIFIILSSFKTISEALHGIIL